MSDYPKFLADQLKLVDQKILETSSSEVDKINIISEYIINSGGKRVRPVFAILAANLFEITNNDHINIAVAVEFIHTATLLHDDVVDGGQLRRGKETVNNKWGNKLAILVGDYLFTQSFLNMVACDSMPVMDTLSQASAVIAEGEVEQLEQIGNVDLNMDQYNRIIRCKTAELFAAACKCGAIVAGQEQQEQKIMYNFGLNFGLAFQIIDDLLDYSENAKSGKSIGVDFDERKVTLPIILLLHKASEKESVLIKDYFLGAGENIKFSDIIQLISHYKVLELCAEKAGQYIQKCNQALDLFDDSEAKTVFLDILAKQTSRLN